MSQEAPSRTSRPKELGLTLYQPKTDVQLYNGAPDLDQKALILNTQIVQVEEATATPGSMRTVAIIVAEQQRGMSQYRVDAVVGLNGENLVAIINGLSAGEQEIIDPVSGAIKRIQRAQEKASLGVAGLTLSQKSEGQDEEMEILEDEVLGEFVERLADLNDDRERSQLITAIDATITPQAIRRLSKHGDALGALIRSANEFENEDLRNVLQRLQEMHGL